MKRLLLILILTLNIQTLTKADDIRDFEIEGMSIGDSLLNYLEKSEIKKIKKYFSYPNKRYYQFVLNKLYINLSTYDFVQVDIENNDKKYKIAMLDGVLEFPKRINQCKNKTNKCYVSGNNEIVLDLDQKIKISIKKCKLNISNSDKLINKIIEEIIRYPLKRNQLLNYILKVKDNFSKNENEILLDEDNFVRKINRLFDTSENKYYYQKIMSVKNNSNKYLIETFGCQMNVYDSELVEGLLQNCGYSATNEIDNADIIFFNTCAIRDKAEETVHNRLESIHYLKKRKPHLLLGVLGCMAQN